MLASIQNSPNIPMWRRREGEAGGDRRRAWTDRGADRTDSGTTDLWPFFSPESRLALALLSTMATSPHYVLPCGSVVCPWQVKKPKRGEAGSSSGKKAEYEGGDEGRHATWWPGSQSATNPFLKKELDRPSLWFSVKVCGRSRGSRWWWVCKSL